MIERTITRMVAAMCALFLCTGCIAFRKDVEAVSSDLSKIEDRVTSLENTLEQERLHLAEMIERARGDVEKLEDTMTRATRMLARNSADFGAEMESLKGRMRKVDGTFAELRHELEQSAAKVDEANKKVVEFALAAGLDLPVDEDDLPPSASAHYGKLKASFAERRYGEVRSSAKVFLQRHKRDRNAEAVQLLVAKTYLAQKRWAKALGALRSFTDKYPKSKLTPEVLYEMARSFFELGDCTDAGILIETLETRHKSSSFSDKARKLQVTIKKQKSRCTS